MKLNLKFQSGSLAGKDYQLEGGSLTFGRGITSDVIFDQQQENMASTKHAHIEAQSDGYYLFDDRSTNGTLLNGVKIQLERLKSGDQIQFGTNGPIAVVEIVAAETESVVPIQTPMVQPDLQPPVMPMPVSPPAPEPVAAVQQSSGFQPSQQPDFRNSMISIGVNEQAVKPPESRTKTYIGAAIAIFGVIFLSLIVLGIFILDIGPVAAVIASIIAFTPACLYILPFIWLDRYDPEPAWLLALAFAWGALVAVIFSFVVNTAIGAVTAMLAGPEAGMLVGAVVSAPIFEEGSKGLGLLLLLIFARREFDDILDGIVYAGVIALGFATVENVLYYGRALLGGGLSMVAILFVIRGLLSPFAHVTFTAMTGIGCGIARESHKTVVKIIMPIVGYCFAVLLHMIWNGVASLGGLETFLAGYIVLQVPFFLIFVGFCIYIMRRQNKILKEMLAMDTARGLITDEQYKTATSAFKSTGWLLSGLFSGKFNARRKFLRNVGKLGLSYWHIQRATAAHGETGSFQANPLFREAVVKWRDQV